MHNIQILKVANKFPIWLPCKKSSTPITRRVAYITEWPVASERIRKWGGGAPVRSEAPEKNCLVVPLHFLALKAQLVVLVSAFVMGQFGQFLVCCSSTHSAPVPHGVGATESGQNVCH